jgi:GH24 family phage-related lysozyme (muramidase)
MDKLILKILREETTRLQIELHNIYLDRVVSIVSLITENDEEREPDMVWDFTDVKQNIDKSKSWVKTKEDVIEYLKNLLKKLENVQVPIKNKIIKYVLYSFLGILSLSQITSIEDEVSGTKSNKSIKTPITKAQTPVEKEIVDVKIRQVSPDLIEHLKYEEGSIYEKGEPVLTAYDLGDGAYTIGYGHAVFRDPRRGDNGGKYKFLPKYNKIVPNKTRITKEQAEILLNDDIQIATESLNKILNTWEESGIKPKITQGMYNSMISLIFNMGITNFRKSDFIQLVKQNRLKEARKEILNISSRMFKKYPGLKIRRQTEYELFK